MTVWLETDELTDQDISSGTVIGSYTSNADREIIVDVLLDQIAGNGNYEFYVTKQLSGAGSAYIVMRETVAVASGVTAAGWQPNDNITVRADDVLTVYVDGLAGDTTDVDTTVRWFSESNPLIAYDGAIWFDSNASNTNTVIGVDGIRTNPVSTLAAAKTLADATGLTKIRVLWSLTIDQDMSGYDFYSWDDDFDIRTTIDTAGANYLDASTIRGVTYSPLHSSSETFIYDCDCNSQLGGTYLINCRLKANVPLDSNTEVMYCEFVDVAISLADASAMTMYQCKGNAEITTEGGTSVIFADMAYGSITLTAACAGGEFSAKGKFTLIDLSTGAGAVVITEERYFEESDLTSDAVDLIWDEEQAGHTVTGSFGEYLDAKISDKTGYSLIDGSMVSVTGTVIASSVTGNVGGNVLGSVDSVTDPVTIIGYVQVTGTVVAASVIADVGITQAGADKVWLSAARTLTSFGTLVADIITAIFVEAVEGTVTFRQWTRRVSAILFGKASGGGVAGSKKFRNLGDTINRVDATTDTSGNRTSVSFDDS